MGGRKKPSLFDIVCYAHFKYKNPYWEAAKNTLFYSGLYNALNERQRQGERQKQEKQNRNKYKH